MRQIRHPRLDQVELTDVMYALSDPARVEIVRRLAGASSPLTCSALDLDRPKSSMSHHFKILREAGVILTEVAGKEHFNRLRAAELEKRFPGLLRAVLRAAKGR
jgi:DNA-binding transcriptional ArsR family regulator